MMNKKLKEIRDTKSEYYQKECVMTSYPRQTYKKGFNACDKLYAPVAKAAKIYMRAINSKSGANADQLYDVVMSLEAIGELDE